MKMDVNLNDCHDNFAIYKNIESYYILETNVLIYVNYSDSQKFEVNMSESLV